MNSLVIGFSGLFLLVLGYIFYSRIVEKLFDVNPQNKTPCFYKYDGVDYVPAKHWSILFGHHFASIAGAGPILGPVIAVAIWGWGPAILWLVLGSIFLGGVHDFSSLMCSLREEGKSIAEVANRIIGLRVKILFSIFIWLALVLVVAVFAAATAKTLVADPKIVLPTFSLILIAILVGFMIYKLKINQVLATVIGLILLAISLYLGTKFPIGIFSLKTWIIILLIYAGIASVIPVNILLQPRDYLSSFILFFGLLYGWIGLILTRPQMQTPAFIKFSTPKGPLWPMMFVFIACGAISGFHSLISSGTTSKQIPNEKFARRIGYGAMILEGVLALLALLSVAAGLKYFGKNSYPVLLKSKGWIPTFATGFGNITKNFFPATVGYLTATIMLNAFVMTTLDSATRITRYITEEILSDAFKIKIFKNRFISTTVVILFALYLALGQWQKIWPIFGASNQLVAALVLIIVSTFLLSRNKPVKITLYPAVFMLLTTIFALLVKIKDFYLEKNYSLLIIGIILIFLAIFLVYESFGFFKKVKGVR